MALARTGDRILLLLFLYHGCVAGAAGYGAAQRLRHDGVLAGMSDHMIAWIVVAAILGMMVGFAIHFRAIGHPGACGIVRSLAAQIMLTLTATLIAGTLIVPLHGTLYGPLVVVELAVDGPVPLAVWPFEALTIHWLMKIWQAEKACAFRRRAPAPAAAPCEGWPRLRAPRPVLVEAVARRLTSRGSSGSL
ncbi:MAG: hypothetical protein CSA65_05380 [Proteobacteria bacterium]|nr:MAG: hypothetical protein CSA65_05380 [Pseudomonadota bacterium]